MTKGWVYDKRNGNRPYRAQIFIEGQYKFIGNYATPEEATAAYVKVRHDNPRNKRSGGNPGYEHPRIFCPRCEYHISVHHFRRHTESCAQKKYPSDEGLDFLF
jgi:hypothetical protein